MSPFLELIQRLRSENAIREIETLPQGGYRLGSAQSAIDSFGEIRPLAYAPLTDDELAALAKDGSEK